MSSIDLSNNALSQKIADHISKKIIAGQLQPGHKLNEAFYAEAYGTSRAPVREAIFLLTVDGLVEKIPRRGAVVRTYTENEIYDLLEIRNNLEALVMKRIIANGTEINTLTEMKRILSEMKKLEKEEEYTQLNHSFHMCMVIMSGSEVIKETYTRLGQPLLTIQNLSFSLKGNIEKSIREHEELLELLEKQEWQKANDLLQSHNADVIKNIQKNVFKTFSNET